MHDTRVWMSGVIWKLQQTQSLLDSLQECCGFRVIRTSRAACFGVNISLRMSICHEFDNDKLVAICLKFSS